MVVNNSASSENNSSIESSETKSQSPQRSRKDIISQYEATNASSPTNQGENVVKKDISSKFVSQNKSRFLIYLIL